MKTERWTCFLQFIFKTGQISLKIWLNNIPELPVVAMNPNFFGLFEQLNVSFQTG